MTASVPTLPTKPSRQRLLLAIPALIWLWTLPLAALPAFAFQQQTAASGCGLRWHGAAAWRLSLEGQPDATLQVATHAQASVSAWESVRCQLCPSDPEGTCWQTCADHVVELALPATTAESAPIHLRVLGPQVPWPHSQWVLGQTTLQASAVTGALEAAEVVVRADATTCTGPCAVDQTDLRAVLTHELGHALGMGHSTDPAAVMRPALPKGQWPQPPLREDDALGLCLAYATQCRSEGCPLPVLAPTTQRLPAEGCSASTSPATSAAIGIALLTAVGVLRRRRRC